MKTVPENHELWKHMHDIHGLTLLESELQDIINLACKNLVIENIILKGTIADARKNGHCSRGFEHEYKHCGTTEE